VETVGWQVPEIYRALNLLVLVFHLVVSIICFICLRKTDFSPLVKVIWVFLILFFPLFGPIAFFIVNMAIKKNTIEI
jgi:hypothetical protein